MSQNPPDPLAGIPAAGGPTQEAAGGDLAEIWSNLWPWADLNAKGQPERYLKLGTEVLPVLAALVASGGGAGPRLLKTDALARLQTATFLDVLGAVAKAQNAGDQVVTPTDLTLFTVGQIVTFGRDNPLLADGLARYEITNVFSDHLSIDKPLEHAIAVGDPIWLQPIVAVDGSLVRVRQDAGSSLSVTDLTPYDLQGESRPAAGVLATVTIAAVAGTRITLDVAQSSIVTGVNAYSGNYVTVKDGATEIWAILYNVVANSAGTGQPIGPKSRLTGTSGNALTVAFAAVAAAQAQFVAVGVYQR